PRFSDGLLQNGHGCAMGAGTARKATRTTPCFVYLVRDDLRVSEENNPRPWRTNIRSDDGRGFRDNVAYLRAVPFEAQCRDPVKIASAIARVRSCPDFRCAARSNDSLSDDSLRIDP